MREIREVLRLKADGFSNRRITAYGSARFTVRECARVPCHSTIIYIVRGSPFGLLWAHSSPNPGRGNAEVNSTATGSRPRITDLLALRRRGRNGVREKCGGRFSQPNRLKGLRLGDRREKSAKAGFKR
jgi:hypothetical protein